MKQDYITRKFLRVSKPGLPNYKMRAIRPGGYADGGEVGGRGGGCAVKGRGKGTII
jgi:hypothetical protein